MSNMPRPGDFTGQPPYLPPHNADLERSLLGSILLNNATMETVAPLVTAEDFFEEVHRRTFEVASALIAAGQVASPVTLKTFLGDHEVTLGLSIPHYLARIVSEDASPLAARSHAMAVRDLAVRRRMIVAAQELIARAHDLPVQVRPSRIAGEAMEELFTLASEDGAGSTRREAHASAAASLERIRLAAAGQGKPMTASTGFSDLDRATGGYRAGDLWILGARPGVGKTVFAVTSANKVARRGVGTLLFSLEVAEPQMTARLLADLAFSSSHRMSFKQILAAENRADAITDEQAARLAVAYETLTRMPLVLDVASRLSPGEIRIRVRAERQRMAARGVDLKVVFIDYLKQVAASDRYKGNRVQEIGEISYSLKQLAKDEGVCVVLLAQLNRELEKREDKRPTLADLRDSGDLEADADVVAFLHREAHHFRNSAAHRNGGDEAAVRLIEMESHAEVILGKNRAGEQATIDLWCDVACATMSDHVRG